jgi:hypothetical protein
MLIILVLESRSWFGVPFGSLIAWLWSAEQNSVQNDSYLKFRYFRHGCTIYILLYRANNIYGCGLL